jgi:hypothetical protein
VRTPADGAQEERHASWLELFFDLVFVVAVAELARQLVLDTAWAASASSPACSCGLHRVAGIHVLRRPVRHRRRPVPHGHAHRDAGHRGARGADPRRRHRPHDAGFVVAYVILRSLLIGLYLRAWRSAPEARPLIARYAGGYSVSVVLWLVSLLVDPPVRYVLWGVGLAIEYAMPVLAQRIHARLPVDPSHVPERFALFTVIVLGESVTAVALGTADQDWRVASALTRCSASPLWPACGGCTSTRDRGRAEQPHGVDADLHARPHPAARGADGRRRGRAHADRRGRRGDVQAGAAVR